MAEKGEGEGKLAPAGGSVGLSLAAVGMGQVPLAPEEANWGGGCWVDEGMSLHVWCRIMVTMSTRHGPRSLRMRSHRGSF